MLVFHHFHKHLISKFHQQILLLWCSGYHCWTTSFTRYEVLHFWGLLPLQKNSPNIVSINKRVQENFVKDIMLNETFRSLIPWRNNILLILWAELRATSKVWEYTEGYILISTYWFIKYLIKVCMYKIFKKGLHVFSPVEINRIYGKGSSLEGHNPYQE